MGWFEAISVTGPMSFLGFLIGSLLTGLAVAWFFLAVGSVIAKPRNDEQMPSFFERDRRANLRELSAIYRWFEPWVDELARPIKAVINPIRPEPVYGEEQDEKPTLYETMRQQMQTAALPSWFPDEFLAAKFIESVAMSLMAIAFLVFACNILGFSTKLGLMSGVLFSMCFVLLYQMLAISEVKSRAVKRLHKIRMALPFAVDMISLMMEAGSDFSTGIRAYVKEKQGHPLADEFTRILNDIERGSTRADALKSFQSRMEDETVSEFTYAVVEGETLGTPIAKILKDQAARMRLKRSQWIEAAAGKAEVSIVFPGMITMIACLLIVITPFVLAALTYKLPTS